ncbi:MAG: acyltransferase [Clostridiales bacterium]|nr:acyltransferase [Clostridiales bacterium]
MRNILIYDLNKKDTEHFTSDFGLFLRRKLDKPFKALCNIFTGANIIRCHSQRSLTDEAYFQNLDISRVPISSYQLKKGKNNIVLERYPQLERGESYIFVCNHTCPEDIETVLNVIDRNAWLVLGSIETLHYDPEMYLLWLNGMIPFDILNQEERKALLSKMERVIKKNSILIFPEGSHNYHPNKIVNNLFDGPVNLARKTGKEIVLITLIRDGENHVSYIDVGNPINVSGLKININDYFPGADQNEKYLVKSISAYLRDWMATAAYHIIVRHFDVIQRDAYPDIETEMREANIRDAFAKLNWRHDVFEAEYLVKRTEEDKAYEEVVRTLSGLRLSMKMLKCAPLDSKEYVQKLIDLQNKDVAGSMRAHWLSENGGTG